jgi:HSP20 family protein
MSLAFWNPITVFGGFDDRHPLTVAHPKDEIMRHTSPRFEVTENDRQFRMAVDVPGIKPENLKIELEDYGRILHVSGERKVKTDTSHEEYLFDKRFKLGRNVDTSQITAHLSDGVLVLSAPKKEVLPHATRLIEIVQGEAPALLDEDDDKKTSEMEA